MTLREKLVLRILLTITEWLAPYGWKSDIKALTTQIFSQTEGV